jgi:hypothetical protein
MTFEPSPFWQSTDTPEPGDIVQLKLHDRSYYSVRTTVTRVVGDEVFAMVDAIYEWPTGNLVQDGDVFRYMGKHLGFHREQVYGVIKKGSMGSG